LKSSYRAEDVKTPAESAKPSFSSRSGTEASFWEATQGKEEEAM
jgi:hypothetical protein